MILSIRPFSRSARRGFTLVEVAVTIVIVGFSVTALMALLAASASQNSGSAELTTAMNLAGNIHELAQRLAFTDSSNHWGMETGETVANCDDVEDLDGQALGTNGTTVVDSLGNAMPSLNGVSWAGWVQQISVALVDPTDVRTTLNSTDTRNNSMMRVTVTILHNSRQIYQQAWVVVKTS